jgi:DNA-binding XRE family transcriptional regulator
MTTFREHLNKKLKDEEFAQAYYEEREKLRIAYEIHAARTRLGWTQRQLAERAGVTQQMISRIENAMTPDVSLNTVDRISRALGLEIGLVRPSHSINPISVKGPTQMVVAKRVSSRKSRSKGMPTHTKK